jgi:hypothetical protein
MVHEATTIPHRQRFLAGYPRGGVVVGPDEHVTASRRTADSSAVPSRQQVADRNASMDAAWAILSTHRPNPDDTCAGCFALWDRWISFGDCAQVGWARRVVETYAACDDEPAEPRQRPHNIRVYQLSAIR